MKNLKTRLEQGENIEFESDNDMMEANHRKTLGGSTEFIIILNCKIIHMSKTFKSFENKLINLISERNLIEC